MPLTLRTPGVYKEDLVPTAAVALPTGVPVFLGFATEGEVNVPQRVTMWSQFVEKYTAKGELAYAVRGFFDNGGSVCYVLRLENTTAPPDPVKAVNTALATIEALDDIDLVCVPDVASLARSIPASLVYRLQRAVIRHCEALGNRFALLDALPNASVEQVLAQRRELQEQGFTGANAALYYPWVTVPHFTAGSQPVSIPPCGHVAGVYARSDRLIGVHKAPANEVLAGVIDLERTVTNAHQEVLNPESINCLRAFPGRGIRVWGARTLSQEPAWSYVNVRRLFLTASRWIERAMAGVVFESNDFMLWVRIERELRAYFSTLFRRGALKGASEEEAFYVKCDAETNSPEVRAAGSVVTEIGLAPASPSEFVVVRLIHGPSGVTLNGPQPN